MDLYQDNAHQHVVAVVKLSKFIELMQTRL